MTLGSDGGGGALVVRIPPGNVLRVRAPGRSSALVDFSADKTP